MLYMFLLSFFAKYYYLKIITVYRKRFKIMEKLRKLLIIELIKTFHN